MGLRRRGHRGLGPPAMRVLAALALYVTFQSPAVAARLTRERRLSEIQGCQPNTMPWDERCEFVRTHAACRPEDGWIPYLEVHYCYLAQMEAATTVLFLLWIAILFGLMLIVAERFFCPSLELISEYLRLPPCVAGATLLSFGNGAPDVFTQLAAISQGDSDSSSPGAISMALSEPLGSGLFVGNIVFALVVFFSGLQEVPVQRSYFLKDCLFYLGGVAAVFALLLHGKVMVWEVALLGAYYLGFIVVTVLLSRGDEPVHADPRRHEVPHRLRPLDSFMRESCRRPRDFSIHSIASHVSEQDTDTEVPLLGPSDTAESPPKAHQQHQRPQLLWGPNLDCIEETTLMQSGDLGSGAGNTCVYGGSGVRRDTVNVVGCGSDVEPYDTQEDEGFQDTELDYDAQARWRAAVNDSGVTDCSSSSCTAAAGMENGIGNSRRRRDGSGGGDTPGGVGYIPPPQVLSPSALAAVLPPPSPPLPFHSAGRTLSGDSSDPYRPYGGGRGHGSLDATSSLRRDVSGKVPGRMEALWRQLERPGLSLLSLFIPRVAIDTHARYRKTCAVVLPPLLPTLVGWSQGWMDTAGSAGSGGGGNGFWQQPWWMSSTAVGLMVAVAAVRWYPQKGHLHGTAAGIATVLVFCEAMVLLDASAGELVSAAVALGQIFGISPSLLGATLLAWGNSVSDLVSNITLAKDGLPSMAITACFASPLFVLLAGLVTSLTYATRHGSMELPHDLALRVLYGCSSSILLMWALVVPLVFRFRLNRRVGVLAIIVYGIYQFVYIWAVVHDSRT